MQPVRRVEGDVGQGERDQFGAAVRAGEPHQQQRRPAVRRCRADPPDPRQRAADHLGPAGGIQPGGGVHLIDRRDPAGQRRGGVPPAPDAGLLGGGLGDVVRQDGGGAGSGGNRRRPAQAANRSQSERYAFFVAAVEASTASSTRARASAGSACS